MTGSNATLRYVVVTWESRKECGGWGDASRELFSCWRHGILAAVLDRETGRIVGSVQQLGEEIVLDLRRPADAS